MWIVAFASLAKSIFAANFEVIITFFDSYLLRTGFMSHFSSKSKQKSNSRHIEFHLRVIRAKGSWYDLQEWNAFICKSCPYPNSRFSLWFNYSSKQPGYYPTKCNFLYQQWSLVSWLKENIYEFICQAKDLVKISYFFYTASPIQAIKTTGTKAMHLIIDRTQLNLLSNWMIIK